jgi:dipeptidyl aminopeptidase/acylaminoacyl peptidase
MIISIKKIFSFLAIIIPILGIFSPAVSAETLPIDAFAMRPAIQRVSVSPNGKHLGLLRGRSMNGQYILEIFRTKNLKKTPIRIASKRMELIGFTWLNNKKILITARNKIKRGNSKWRSRRYIINSDGSGGWRLLPNEGNAGLMSLLPHKPNEILLYIYTDGKYYPNIVRYNINSGRKQTIFRGNDKLSSGYIADYDGEIRAATGFDIKSYTVKYYARLKGSKKWISIKENKGADRVNYNILGFDPDHPNELFISANNGEDKASIYSLDIATGKIIEKIFGTRSADAGNIITSRKPNNFGQLLGFKYATSEAKNIYINKTEKSLYDAVKKLFPHEVSYMISRSDDDNNIIIVTSGPKDSGTFYLLQNKSKLTYIGSKFPRVKPEHLSKVKFFHYKARDGLKIPAYLTIPKGKGPFPTVIMPHGGPWARDFPGYDEWSQLLAHHGYLVVQPQYRGSTGFGLKLWKAGDAQWGYKMQDDLDDAMAYLVKKGLADNDRLAIFGWSYGGYAAFVGSMRKNNIYKCSVAGAGVSDMGRISAQLFKSPIQGATVKGLSPIDHVEDVNIPIMVVHGDIDQRVNFYHSRVFVDKLKDLGKPHKFVVLEGADHFSDTLFYPHKKKFYTALLDWLENTCFTK